MFELPLAETINILYFTDSMKLAIMPFSNMSLTSQIIFPYSNSLRLILLIEIASVNAQDIHFIFNLYVLPIFEPVLDGLKFRLQ